MKTITKYLVLLTISLLLWNCSSTSETAKSKSDETSRQNAEDNNVELAKEEVISASLKEMKGDYLGAINDYQKALELDPTPGIHFSLGKNFLRIKKLPPALLHAKSAVQADSLNLEYNYLLASVYQFADERDSAASVYEKIVQIDSTEQRAYYALAKLYQPDQPMKSLELYHKLLKITGPEWNILVAIADLNERMGNVEETIKTIEELTEVDPSNLRIRKLLIESYLKTKKYEKVLALTGELLQQYPDDVSLLEYRANALVQSGDWEEGSDEYMKLTRREDLPVTSKIKIGGAFFSHSAKDSTSLEMASDIFNRIDQDTTHWQVKLYLAQIALQKNNDSTAIDYFYEAAELAPWNPQIYMSLGGLLFDSGRYQDAIDLIQPAIERFPDEFVLNVVLGLSYAQILDYENAEPYLKKSLLLNPSDFTALYGYGVTLNQLDKEEEALIYLERALEHDSTNTSLLGTIGLLQDNLGNYEESTEYYERALEINPGDPLVLNNYAYALAERDEALQRALEMVNRAVEFDSTNSSYLDTKGWVYYKLGEYGKAKYYIEKSLEFDSDNAEVLDHLGDVNFKLDNPLKAVEYWERAYELDPERDGLKEKLDKGTL